MNTEQIILKSRPKGLPTQENFKREEIELPEIKDDEVLLKGMYYSVDPYMRGRMNDTKSYVPPFETGKPLSGGVVAEVIASKSEKFQVGDSVTGNLPWKRKMIAAEKDIRKIDSTMAPASYYLGILGMTGLTSYFGLMHIGKPKAGETVVVSGAAGAVGMVVGQIAKIKGCRVIGIAGSDEKIQMLKEELGFSHQINYKTTTDMKKALAKACPKGVDVYFDNVGGDISDAIMMHLNFQARVVICGQISLYNSTETPMGPRLQPILLTRSVLMQGFIISDFQSDFPEGIQHLVSWIKEGKLKFKETVVHGFEKLPQALLGLFKGDNTGKMIVKA